MAGMQGFALHDTVASRRQDSMPTPDDCGEVRAGAVKLGDMHGVSTAEVNKQIISSLLMSVPGSDQGVLDSLRHCHDRAWWSHCVYQTVSHVFTQTN